MAELASVKVAKSVPASVKAAVSLVTTEGLGRQRSVSRAALDRAGFTGAVNTSVVLDDGDRATVLVGLGPTSGVCTDSLRRGGAAAARLLARHRRASLVWPEIDGLDPAAACSAIAEGILLGSYSFDEFRSPPSEPRRALTVTLVRDLPNAELRNLRAAVERASVVADAVAFARDLVNTPGGTLTPEVFAERAAERARNAGLEVEVLDEDGIRNEELGGLIAVNKGSIHPPRFVVLRYSPDESLDPTGDTLALVGKGITFDSGGLSIKPADGMIGMKMDMGGAAAVIAAMCALPALGARTAAVSYTPMTDNMIDGDAQRPGDVFTARGGTTVEVLNTDAEGRLVLADALVMACEEEPAGIVDLATLTGACLVALGDRIAGLMANDDGFRDRVAAAAARAGERVWPLPLPADYRRQLDSKVADIANIGGGRYGGTLTAGLFLQEFVAEGVPWAHLDIAGPAYLDQVDGEQGPGATGFGVRTLLSLVENWGGGNPAEDE
ncbi:MAG: leucyl aminopeptidase [Actinobacteria bacterium]|nr:leucyl aminopeptidase [Actinomycetota bacterium]